MERTEIERIIAHITEVFGRTKRTNFMIKIQEASEAELMEIKEACTRIFESEAVVEVLENLDKIDGTLSRFLIVNKKTNKTWDY